MENQKKKIIAIVITSLFLISMVASTSLTVNAHSPPWTIQTYAYVNAAPQSWGIGSSEPILIVFWINSIPPTAAGVSGDRWLNMTIQITTPSGQVLSYGPFTSDPVGGNYLDYNPTATGNYSVLFTFPTQPATLDGGTGILNPAAPSPLVNDTYLGSTATTTFTVTNTPVSYFQEAPLPGAYWTRPINENNQYWYTIAGAWLGQNEFGATFLKSDPMSGDAPNTAHVINTYPLTWGGIVGGSNAAVPDISFYSGTQYQLKFADPIIMYGTVYFSLPQNNAPTGNGIAAMDLRSGKIIWTNPNIQSVAIGQMYDFESPNQHGVTGDYLWATGMSITGSSITNPGPAATAALTGSYAPGTDLGIVAPVTSNTPVSTTGWVAVDPQTGKLLFNETNVPSGTRAYGPLGEWLIYNIGAANSSAPFTYLWQWNNTKIPGNDLEGGVTQWIPGTGNWNMSASYDWNVTLSQPLTATTNQFGTFNPTVVRAYPGDLILGQSSGMLQTPGTGSNSQGTGDPFTLWAINLNATRAPIGQVLWDKAFPAPAGNITVNIGPSDSATNVLTLYYKETMQWVGIDMLTGNQIWGPTATTLPAWNFYTGTTGLTSPIGCGEGHLYVAGYGGVLYAFNLQTGHLDFTYGNNINDPNNSTYTPETAYGDYPTQVAAIADDKVYLVEEEHSENSPTYHGAMTRCVNATTGQLLWEMYGMSSWQEQAVADGYYTWFNLNDQQVYVNGPGPSATTVTASPSVATQGGSVLISGTVTDQSPALKGTAAISDADQGVWMDYMIQHDIAAPTNVTGVPVSIDAIDPNGNFVHIADVTSDQSGLFSTLWKPSTPGQYTIVATFAGSQSYGASYAETAAGLTQAQATTPTPTATSTSSAADIYFVPAIAGLFILIIAVAVVLTLLILRKK